MKKIIWVLLMVTPGIVLQAQQQQPEQQAPFQKFPSIPPFKLLKVDSSTYVTKEDIKKHHLTMIMFFSPECDHCKHQTEDILSESDKFKNIEIVMATFQPFPEMKEFYNHYRIADHPNIKMGRDDKYVLPPFYRIQSLPFLALYDKKGDLITTFQGNQKVDKILTAFGEKK